MTKEQAIEVLEKEKAYMLGHGGDRQAVALDMAIKTLEQQPSEDKVTIQMDKGTLKYSGQGYVVYNKDWFRKHFATEVAIMTGYEGYKGQPTIEEILSHITTGITATGQGDSYCVGFCNALIWLKSCITHEEPQFFEDKVGKWLSAEEYALKIGAEVNETIKNSLYKFCPFCEQTVFMECNYCPNCGCRMTKED